MKNISLTDVAVGTRAVEALAPALARIVAVDVITTREVATEFFIAVAQSPSLSRLAIRVTSTAITNTVVRDCLDSLMTTSLESLQVSPIVDSDIQTVIDAAVARGKRFRILELQNPEYDTSLVECRAREWRLCGE